MTPEERIALLEVQMAELLKRLNSAPSVAGAGSHLAVEKAIFSDVVVTNSIGIGHSEIPTAGTIGPGTEVNRGLCIQSDRDLVINVDSHTSLSTEEAASRLTNALVVTEGNEHKEIFRIGEDRIRLTSFNDSGKTLTLRADGNVLDIDSTKQLYINVTNLGEDGEPIGVKIGKLSVMDIAVEGGFKLTGTSAPDGVLDVVAILTRVVQEQRQEDKQRLEQEIRRAATLEALSNVR